MTSVGTDDGARSAGNSGVDPAAAIEQAAARLQESQRTGRPCAPVREILPDRTVATGYAVQQVLTRDKLAQGRRIVGRKIGLTSPAVQAQLDVNQPDFGVLFDDMAYTQDDVIDIGLLLQPRVEAEIAFVLAVDLPGDADEATARAAVAEVIPALEIVDSRVADWDITIVDTVADNASSGVYVLGDSVGPLGERDLREVQMTLTDGSGAVVSDGSGAACLGDPVQALLWLARAAAEYGSPLRAGDLILSGALGPIRPVGPGDEFTATLSGLGTVRARFSSRPGTTTQEA